MTSPLTSSNRLSTTNLDSISWHLNDGSHSSTCARAAKCLSRICLWSTSSIWQTSCQFTLCFRRLNRTALITASTRSGKKMQGISLTSRDRSNCLNSRSRLTALTLSRRFQRSKWLTALCLWGPNHRSRAILNPCFCFTCTGWSTQSSTHLKWSMNRFRKDKIPKLWFNHKGSHLLCSASSRLKNASRVRTLLWAVQKVLTRTVGSVTLLICSNWTSLRTRAVPISSLQSRSLLTRQQWGLSCSLCRHAPSRNRKV